MTLGEFRVPGDDGTHFNRPTDIAFLANGDFFVSDGYNNTRVAKFNAAGEFLLDWGEPGNGPASSIRCTASPSMRRTESMWPTGQTRVFRSSIPRAHTSTSGPISRIRTTFTCRGISTCGSVTAARTRSEVRSQRPAAVLLGNVRNATRRDVGSASVQRPTTKATSTSPTFTSVACRSTHQNPAPMPTGSLG